MTVTRQVLLELICYASNQGKPAVLRLRAEHIAELCTRELIEKHEDGYWITELGREQCNSQPIPGRDFQSPMEVAVLEQIQRGSLEEGPAWDKGGSGRHMEAC
jgi:hypothetical protein